MILYECVFHYWRCGEFCPTLDNISSRFLDSSALLNRNGCRSSSLICVEEGCLVMRDGDETEMVGGGGINSD